MDRSWEEWIDGRGREGSYGHGENKKQTRMKVASLSILDRRPDSIGHKGTIIETHISC